MSRSAFDREYEAMYTRGENKGGAVVFLWEAIAAENQNTDLEIRANARSKKQQFTGLSSSP